MTDPVTICHEPGPGETRDCLDPWKMTYVKADGGVSLCCWARPVGNVKVKPIQEILADAPAREMRRGLLTGRVPEDCVRCPARAVVPVATLRSKVEAYMADDDRQELIRLRSRLNGLHDEHAALRRHAKHVEDHSKTFEEHAKNLEVAREHLERHVEILRARVSEVDEARRPLASIVVRWMRSRLRRSALGRKWSARRTRASTTAAS